MPQLGRSAALAICLMPALVFAQQQQQSAAEAATEAVKAAPDAKAQPIARKDGDPLELQKVVVTGAGAKTTKFQTSYGITTIDDEKLDQIKPNSANALFSEVPGVWSESTGGETSGNLYVRGLPSNGGEKFVPLLADGLPIYQEPEVGFMNADTFFRIGPMIDRTEFVRGGPASVFYSNASAGAFNFLNRRGTRDWQGELSETWGNYNHLKTEGYVSGPINDRLSFATGGYYRVDDGQRPPGFTANNGGELKSALTYRDADTTASVYWYHLDDRTYFQTDLPFLNSSASTLTISPQPVPGLSLNTGTLASPDLQRVNLLTGNGANNYDLGNGIHSAFDTVGFEIFHDLGNGWKFEDRTRFTTGSNDFNALFSGGTQQGPALLAQNASNPYWVKMQAAFPTVTSLQLQYQNNPSQVFDPVNQNGNGLVADQGWWHGLITARNFIQELKETKSFDAMGRHDLTFGQYFSYANLHTQDNLNFGNLLTDTTNQPRILNLVGLDASGKVVGSYTYNGFTSFANYLNNVQDETTTYAAFLNDNWQVSKQLRVDAGLRLDHESINTNFENSNTVNLQGSPLANGSNALALQSVGNLNGTYDTYSPKFHATSWSLGADYQFNDHYAAFARYSEPQRLPRTEDGWVASNRATQLTQKLTSLEAGLKVNLHDVAAFLTFYQSKDDAYPFYSYNVNEVTGAQTPVLTLAKTESHGLEAEVIWRPGHGPFDLSVNATLAKSRFTSFNQTTTTIDAFGNQTVSSNDYTGKQIPHIPSVMLQLTPGYNFEIGDHGGRVFASWRYAGARYLDNGNTFRLPGYSELSLGGFVDATDNLRFQFNVQNALNSVGMTEGGCSLCGTTPTSSVLGSNPNVFSGRPLLPRTILLTARYKF